MTLSGKTWAAGEALGAEHRQDHNALADAVKNVRGIDVTSSDYGAVGDGVTDDTDELQAALDAADEGDTVFLPNKTFVGSVQIRTAGVTLTGPGTIKTPDSVGSGEGEGVAAVYVLAEGVTVDGIGVDGNRDNNPVTPNRKMDGIGVYASDVTVRNCRIHDTVGHGIIVWYEAFDDITAGGRDRILIAGNRLWDIERRAAIDVASPNAATADICSQITICHNRIGGSFNNGITLHTARLVEIYGNHVETNQVGLNVHSDSEYVTVRDNTSIGGTVGMQSYNGASKIRILGNRLHGTTGLRFAEDGGADPTDVTVRDNFIDGDTDAITYEDSTGLRIVDNTVDGTFVADSLA